MMMRVFSHFGQFCSQCLKIKIFQSGSKISQIKRHRIDDFIVLVFDIHAANIIYCITRNTPMPLDNFRFVFFQEQSIDVQPLNRNSFMNASIDFSAFGEQITLFFQQIGWTITEIRFDVNPRK